MVTRRTNVELAAELIGGLCFTAGVVVSVFWLLRRRRQRSSQRRSTDLPRLTAAIVGSSKTAVASVLGPPRVATFVGPTSGDFRDAAIWYYPLPREGRSGMAIRFDADRVQGVEIIRGVE